MVVKLKRKIYRLFSSNSFNWSVAFNQFFLPNTLINAIFLFFLFEDYFNEVLLLD